MNYKDSLREGRAGAEGPGDNRLHFLLSRPEQSPRFSSPLPGPGYGHAGLLGGVCRSLLASECRVHLARSHGSPEAVVARGCDCAVSVLRRGWH